MNVNLLKIIFRNTKRCDRATNNIILNRKINTFLRPSRACNGFDSSKKYPSQNSTLVQNSLRCYCEKTGPPIDKLPPLMEFSRLVWPSVFKSFKNLLLTTFIIKPYFDPEFILSDFVTGSKKAIEVVSHRLSNGDIKDLNGLVTSDVIPILHKAISVMSLGQRELISINMDDIYLAFPYQIGVMFNDEESSQNQKRFVEITMVYHTLKGLAAMRSIGEEPPLNVGMIPEYQAKISICNYRFIKEFTKGVESDWTINLLNHFRPIDHQ